MTKYKFMLTMDKMGREAIATSNSTLYLVLAMNMVTAEQLGMWASLHLQHRGRENGPLYSYAAENLFRVEHNIGGC